MKATQILYLALILIIIYWIATSTDLIDSLSEGFENIVNKTEPVIPKVLAQEKLDTEAMPNPSTLGALPFGPYGQMASVGSFQYQDPAMLPAILVQMKKINEDIRSFIVFESPSIANSSDPSVQLPLTQLRADSQKLHQEITTLDKNPGIQSQLTQQDLADIEGSLMFLQKKVRLFETSGVISQEKEGFQGSTGDNKSGEKTRATKADLEELRDRVNGAILKLSASGTVDPVVQSRIRSLNKMYTDLTDMVTKLNKGQMAQKDIPVYKEDINEILPKLDNTKQKIKNIFGQGDGKKLNPIEQQISTLVGTEHAKDVFKSLKDKGMFKISLDLGYNVGDSMEKLSYKTHSKLHKDGSMKTSQGLHRHSSGQDSSSSQDSSASSDGIHTDLPFDTKEPGMDDRHATTNPSSEASRFDWKKRATTICEQVKLRGLDPLDFGCIPKDSLTSPAYSWRGHAKMVCGRLGTTMDPDLPIACGCPPQKWKGWTLSV
jgi:hypothetical protein